MRVPTDSRSSVTSHPGSALQSTPRTGKVQAREGSPPGDVPSARRNRGGPSPLFRGAHSRSSTSGRRLAPDVGTPHAPQPVAAANDPGETLELRAASAGDELQVRAKRRGWPRRPRRRLPSFAPCAAGGVALRLVPHFRRGVGSHRRSRATHADRTLMRYPATVPAHALEVAARAAERPKVPR